MKKSLIQAYAELIVKSGIALQKGQYVVIEANVDQESFVSLLVEECYKDGAKRVLVRWDSQKASRTALLYGDKEELATLTSFEDEQAKWDMEHLPAKIWIDSDDPDGNAGVDPEKVAYVHGKRRQAIKKYREKMENHYQWCIAGAPSKEWAKKVFPEENEEAAMEKLWEAILLTSRAADGNGVENWKRHDAELKKRCAYLNSLRLKSLHYTSSNGTDLTVGLIPGVIFLGGGERVAGTSLEFEPNIPSEECFTSPKRGEAEGIVYAAKPLVYNGQLIKNFWVKFHEGKAIDVGAEQGEGALRSILSIDEGSAYLGECALVPYDSPINNTGLLFYSTLYDENAACHLALGMGFTELYPDYEKYTQEQLHAFGINDSTSHVDFMIGSKDLSIVGTTEKGEQVQIFQDGNWAFSL